VFREVFTITNSLDKDCEMGLIKPIYKVITPSLTGNFSDQWNNCLQQLVEFSQNSTLKPIRANVFVKSNNQADYLAQVELIEKSFLTNLGNECPPFSVVMQEPDDPFLVIIEAGFADSESATIQYGIFQNRPYCIVDTPNYKEFWTLGAQSVHPDFNILASSRASFNYLQELYKHLGLTFDNIVRQWNYVGEILSKEVINELPRQHYQMFNETRSSFYRDNRKRTDFPAATGIGMLYLGVCIDCFAVSGNQHLKIIPISNPNQNESYKYGQSVLVGAPDCTLKQNQPPQFERALLLVLNNASRLIISGTASIIGQETIGIDDIEEQTKVTIQNIETLAKESTLKNQYPELKSLPTNYSYVRVYVKYKKDIDTVRGICQSYFGEVPITYVVADICRDNLLVEIEAELVS
jgi:enamine deaminase RidA (YjgF/YER057c/UK114 family)